MYEIHFRTKRRWVKFQIITKMESGEFAEEGVSLGFIDANTIESFYATDKGIIIEMESGNAFLVDHDLDFVFGVVNESA